MALLVATHDFPSVSGTVHEFPSSVATDRILTEPLAALLAAHLCLPRLPPLLPSARTTVVLAVPARPARAVLWCAATEANGAASSAVTTSSSPP